MVCGWDDQLMVLEVVAIREGDFGPGLGFGGVVRSSNLVPELVDFQRGFHQQE